MRHMPLVVLAIVFAVGAGIFIHRSPGRGLRAELGVSAPRFGETESIPPRPTGTPEAAEGRAREWSRATSDARLDQVPEERNGESLDNTSQSCVSSIEASLFGTLDPGAILCEAQRVLRDGVIDSRPLVGLTPSGQQRFSVDGEPQGVEAELLMPPAPRPPELREAVTLKMSFARPGGQQYMIEGIVRDRPSASLTCWTDPQGDLSHFVIMTKVDPDYRGNFEAGVALTEGRVVEGLHYHIDLTTMQQSLKEYGLDGGQPFNREIPLDLLGNGWPSKEDIGRFGNDVIAAYRRIKSDD